MAKTIRDEFKKTIKLEIEKNAGRHCSDPSCRQPTRGPKPDGTGEINLGVAAHICAASPLGPRYDKNQTPEQRSSAANGIWLCQNHAHAIDVETSKFTAPLLREWKKQAREWAWQRVLHNNVPQSSTVRSPTEAELSTRLRAAAAADLEVFLRLGKWPSTNIPLMLEVDGLSDPVNTSALATALTTLDNLILVAPPGMGKTTTIFQITEAILAKDNASPIVVPLGDWSTDGATILESILKRPAFRDISENDLRDVAAKPGLILLLDGWNELDVAARKRLAVQVTRLQAELPELSLLISTRKQTLDVPVDGTRINLLPLSETQQFDIAKALRSDAGVRMLDQAWRTTGVRELVTIPLYLTALVALPEGAPFPTTKEEVLRRFVSVHDENTQRAEALAEVTYGLQQRFLEDLAATANCAANTTIPETVARKSVSETESALVSEGQITEKPQPNTVLEALVSHHLLLRIGDPAGYSFQHQQFQEWYASHFVERLVASIGDTASRNTLKANVLNFPVWEESILFACERLARGDLRQQECCGAAIMAAFEVDPMLAAEMIFRSTDAIWVRVGSAIQGFIERWHTPGQIDRALHFMMRSGRPEFLDQVWPLITHENDQIHLRALRAGTRFRPSLLGSNASKRIAALPPRIRTHVLYEIVMNSGMDGLDLAAAIAKDDPGPEVKAEVIAALAFRHASRHVADVLRYADEKTFDLVLCKDMLDDVTDERINKRMEEARERQRKGGASAHDRLRTIVYAQGDKNLGDELTAIIAEMEIDKKSDGVVNLIYMVRNRYSLAIADGLLQRVRAGRTLFYGADDLLASANLGLEDEELIEIALAETARHDDRAEAAASVLGPLAVSRIIETAFEVKKHVRDANGKYDKVVGERYDDLLDRLRHAPGASLVAAVRSRSAQAGNEEMEDLADLISRHPDDEGGRGRHFDADAFATIRTLVEDWGNRMLESSDATRSQLSSIATLVRRAPSVGLLGLLKRLLDENLRRYRAFRQEAEATGGRQGKVMDEDRTAPHIHEYERAFRAINAPETAALMCEYLHDEHFRDSAALVLAAQWTAENEPSQARHLWGGVDFSHVEERRAARTKDPAATSAEAEAIFGAIEPLIADDATEAQKRRAVTLSIVAARLPHGQRDTTIQKLISLASRRQRAALLQNLILSGENVNIELVKNGLSEMFEAAKNESWILQDGYELRDWLRLLPFSNPTAEVSAIVRGLPNDHRRVDWLEDMISGFRTAPGDDAERVLFQLAEDNPDLYGNHVWRDTATRRGTLSSARRFVDLAANGAFKDSGIDQWNIARQIAGLMSEHAELRTHIYQLLVKGSSPPGLALLAQAVAEAPDADGLLLLIKHNPSFISRLTIERVVTEHVPSEDLQGAYSIVPAPGGELRQKLLAMTVTGNRTAVATHCLHLIDEIRDDYGAPDSEPRHPDLASGKQWPIMNGPEYTA